MGYRPNFRITTELLRLITEAAEAYAWIKQSSSLKVPWLAPAQKDTAARLAHSSTAIEGNSLSLSQAKAIDSGKEAGGAEKEKLEIKNYLAALRWIWAQNPSKPIGENELLRLHKLLTQKILPADEAGHYKKKPNQVVDAKGQPIYIPPSPDKTKGLTQNMLSWLNSSESKKLHPIIISAIAHHQLLSIHPFSDGNGRAARALGIWILYHGQFDTRHLLALDEYFEENRRAYYEKIQQARELDDDLTVWLEYVALGVVEALKKTKERILSLNILIRSPGISLTQRQEELLRFLRDRGKIKSPELEKELKVTRARISQIMQPLVKAGLVLREGKTRATTYRLAEE